MSGTLTSTTPTRRPWQLVTIGLIFALPLIASWVFFLNPQWLPGSQSNNGTLVLPPKPVAHLNLQQLNGDTWDWETLKGKWTIVSLAKDRCEAACQQQLLHAGRIREAVGAERQRIRRLLIFTGTNPQVAPDNLPAAEDLFVLKSTQEQQKAVSDLFVLTEHNPAEQTFLIDPLGYFMMTHRDDLPDKALLRDVEKLLKASQTWEKGGKYGH